MNEYIEEILLELKKWEELNQKLVEEVADMDEYPLGYNPYQE